MSRVAESGPHARVRGHLATSGARATVWRHADSERPITSPEDFARWVGRPVGAVTKTLFLEKVVNGTPAGYALAVCSCNLNVDTNSLARRWNVSQVRLASRTALGPALGYEPQGVSPLGCDGYPVAIDESAFAHGTIFVGGGVPGVEVELAPAELQRLTGASRVAFAH